LFLPFSGGRGVVVAFWPHQKWGKGYKYTVPTFARGQQATTAQKKKNLWKRLLRKLATQ